MLRAMLPSDMWSWAGMVYVTVRTTHVGTRVDAATQITGQIMDWGKSTRCLEALFVDLRSAPA